MPNYQGVWSLSEQFQAIGQQNWPMAPGAPTGVSAAAGNEQATVSFTAPTFEGVPPNITGYLATSNPEGLTATGSASPLTVTGLTNGTSYTFTVQATNGVQYGPAGASGGVTPENPPVALFMGGIVGSTKQNTVDTINIASTGNASDFGDLLSATTSGAGCSSSARGLFGGGSADGSGEPSVNVIQYFTFASSGNATDFGNLTAPRKWLGSCSSSTRGVWVSGNHYSYSNVMDYVTIASTGNATDFGDFANPDEAISGCASSTRGVFAGGYSNNAGSIDYITIASAGNSTSFGDLIMYGQSYHAGMAAFSSSTRGVFAGGSPNTNQIQYVTIASTGNGTDFGDLYQVAFQTAGTSSSVRGVIGGGISSGSTRINVMQYVTIATTGNSSDFGDLTVARSDLAACSSAHGGLS